MGMHDGFRVGGGLQEAGRQLVRGSPQATPKLVRRWSRLCPAHLPFYPFSFSTLLNMVSIRDISSRDSIDHQIDLRLPFAVESVMEAGQCNGSSMLCYTGGDRCCKPPAPPKNTTCIREGGIASKLTKSWRFGNESSRKPSTSHNRNECLRPGSKRTSSPTRCTNDIETVNPPLEELESGCQCLPAMPSPTPPAHPLQRRPYKSPTAPLASSHCPPLGASNLYRWR